MTDILDADVMVISKKGKVLGMSTDTSIPKISELITDEVGGFIDGALNDRLLGILSTKENVNLETLGFVENTKAYRAIITPIDIAGERLGTLFIYRGEQDFGIDDIIVSEYGTTVACLRDDALCQRGKSGGDKKSTDRAFCDRNFIFFRTRSNHIYF